MSRDRRLGWLLVGLGGALVFGLQVVAPVGVPLYDGVPVVEPYRYLHPTGDHAGAPTSFEATLAVEGSVSPVISAYTQEQPPQAQLIAQRDAFEVPSGVTSIKVSIQPIEPPAAVPPDGAIAGNVYRFSVTDTGGTPLRTRPCDGCRSLIIRAPEGSEHGTVMRYDGTAWVDVPTTPAGTTGQYQTNADTLGDFAVVAGAPASTGPDPLLVVAGVAVAVIVLALGGLFVLGRRAPGPTPEVRSGPGRGRVPSKRKGPRKPPPPSGRAGR